MKRRGIETVKSILIILLSVSAVAMILQTALFQEGLSGYGSLRNAVKVLYSGTVPAAENMETAAAAVPVQMAATGETGRYAAVRGTDELEAAFTKTSAIFSEALGSAGEAVPIGSGEWYRALEKTGIYIAFDSKIPVYVLAKWLSSQCPHTFAASRYLVCCTDADTVALLYSDGEEYFSCSTSALPRSLDEYIFLFRPNGARFGFELAAVSDSYKNVDPCSLTVGGMNEGLYLYSYRGAISSEQYSSLMEKLVLNPYAEKGYVDKDGWDVYLLSGGTLKVRSDGQVSYRVTEPGRIDALGLQPGKDGYLDDTQIIEATRGFTMASAGADCGDADVYLSAYEKDGERITVTYSFYIDGLLTDIFAARYVYEGSRPVQLELNYKVFLRQNTQTDILQPQFAAAIYPEGMSGMMRMGYETKSAGILSACWMIR